MSNRLGPIFVVFLTVGLIVSGCASPQPAAAPTTAPAAPTTAPAVAAPTAAPAAAAPTAAPAAAAPTTAPAAAAPTAAPAAAAPTAAAATPAASQASTTTTTAEIKGLVKAGYLTVADTGKAPPNTQTGADGKPEGAWIDLCNQWAQDLGLKLEVVYLDWPGVLPGLQAGKFDLAGSAVLRTPARLASKDFVMSDAFNAEGVMLMVKKDSGIKSWDDMKGKTLGIIRGESEGEVATAKVGKIVASTVELPGKQEGLLELQNGRVDGFAAGASGLAYMLKTAPQGGDMTLVGPALEIKDEGVAIRKDLPELTTAINGLIAKYMADGTLDKIYAKWYGTPSPVDTLRELQKNPDLAAPPAPTATPAQ